MSNPQETRVISVSAVILADAEGRWVTVRKTGTSRFMLPGGKPEPGESSDTCAIREVAEELGLHLSPDELEHVGAYVTDTANEPGHVLHSEVFRARCPGEPTAAAEIAEARWVDPTDLGRLSGTETQEWAPLLLTLAREG